MIYQSYDSAKGKIRKLWEQSQQNEYDLDKIKKHIPKVETYHYVRTHRSFSLALSAYSVSVIPYPHPNLVYLQFTEDYKTLDMLTDYLEFRVVGYITITSLDDVGVRKLSMEFFTWWFGRFERSNSSEDNFGDISKQSNMHIAIQRLGTATPNFYEQSSQSPTKLLKLKPSSGKYYLTLASRRRADEVRRLKA